MPKIVRYLKSLRPGATLLAAILIATIAAPVTQAGEQPLTVYAAASLKNAMDDVVTAYRKKHQDARVRVSYAGSSTLARQIENGAPADVFVSANQKWMDRLDDEHLLQRHSRRNLLGNALVLVAPRDSDVQLNLHKSVDLRGQLGHGERLAMADTRAVPAGIYGKEALQWLGSWSALNGHIAESDDVRAALALVSRHETPLGIVYASDATADQGVRIVDTFPPPSHQPIIYPAAAMADSHAAADADFLQFLASRPARQIFKHWGFKTRVDADAH